MLSVRKQRGFSLLESILAIIVLMGAAYIALLLFKQKSQTETVSTLIGIEASELNMLLSASQQYVSANSSGWTPGTVYNVPISSMVTANELPANFATRNGSLGTSPLFETYVVYAMLSTTDNQPRIMVTTASDPATARLARYGMQLAITDVQVIQQQIMEKAQALVNNPDGIVVNGTKTVTGNYGAFTEDVSSFYTTTASYARPALLYGYPDLNSTSGPPTNGSKYKYCTIAQPFTPYGSPTSVQSACAAGWTQLAQFPYCGNSNSKISPQYAVYGSPVGDITLDNQVDESTVIRTDTTWCYSMPSGTCQSTHQVSPPGYDSFNEPYTNSVYYTNVKLNGAIVATDTQCANRMYTQYSMPLGGSCYFSGPGSYPCVYISGGTNATITNLNPAYDKLCCLAN